MDNNLFQQAEQLYAAADYNAALRAYSVCLKGNVRPVTIELGKGLVYHKIGNCFVKLKQPTQALQSYTQALNDLSYDAKGALHNNIGMVYAELRDFDQAIQHFEQAIADPTYNAAYKAYMGLGNARLKQGDNGKAGMAFREAALDAANPDPAKALLNLGICFMALERPQDAIASYKSALDFDTSKATKNRLYASMGQAYAAQDKMHEAAEAFELAIKDGTYSLSDSASVDYQRAINVLAHEAAAAEAAAQNANDLSGLDVLASGIALEPANDDPFFYDEGYENIEQLPGYFDAYDQAGENHFFETTDSELEQWSKDLARKDRKRRNVGLKIVITLIVLVIIALGIGIFGFTQGYGWPTQQAVAQELFANPSDSQKLFSDSLSSTSINYMLDPVVTDSNITVNSIDRSMSDSTLYVTANAPQGGEVYYKIEMIRDMLGWKISDVELYFPSQE